MYKDKKGLDNDKELPDKERGLACILDKATFAYIGRVESERRWFCTPPLGALSSVALQSCGK
ncbi:hypothetical protein J6590_020978 [Homalodisca vitripennis]|nr:hypothetical protein J6590_020978 [Homalodisca vitripennis]